MKKIKIVSALLTILLVITFGCDKEMELIKTNADVEQTDSVASDTTGKDTTTANSLIAPGYFFTNETGFLKTYIKGHPKLMLTKDKITELKANYNSDPQLRTYIDQVLSQAKNGLSSSEPVYVSGRLLDIGWNAFYAIPPLSFAYLWTGDKTYAAKAKSIMLKLSAFPNWYPTSFIDTGVIGLSVAIGLDWGYDYLDASSRDIITKALINKLLIPAQNVYTKNTGSWQNANSNWNAICNSAAIVASLAVAEYDRTYAKFFLDKAIKSIQIPMTDLNYGPWHEGTIYENVTLNMISYSFSSVLTALDKNDLGLKTAGKTLYNAADFYASSHNRSNMTFCYSDILEKSKRQVCPSAFFYGSLFNNDNVIANEQEYLKSSGANVFHVIWYKKVAAGSQFGTSKYFGGKIPTSFFLDNTYANNSIYLAVKGGENGKEHGHLDLGGFEMDAVGVRWIRDLGYDNYNLPGMFDMKSTGKRWTYFRVSSFSHSVPIINNSSQDYDGKATITRHSLDKNNTYSIINLTNGYKKYATSLTRGVKLIDNNRSILIQDEFSLKSSQECYSGFTTDASISIIDSKSAKLTLNGKTLYAKLLSANCTFSVVSAAQSSPQNPNKGVSRLIAKKPKDSTLNFTIAVLLSPDFSGTYTKTATVTPSSSW